MMRTDYQGTRLSKDYAFLLAYIALLTYGTWFPIGRWTWEIGGIDAFLQMAVSQRAPLSDLVINVLVYVPVGALLTTAIRAKPLFGAISSAFVGLALSAVLEFGQTYLPGRVTSLLDIILNTTGALVGALLVSYVVQSQFTANVYARVVSELRHKGSGRLGLLAVALWIGSQWAPFVPSLDVGQIRYGLSPFAELSAGAPPFFMLRILEYTLMLSGLSAITIRLFQDRELTSKLFAGGIFFVLAVKVLILTRQLSPEALIGAFIATVVTLRLKSMESTALQVTALLSLASFQVLDTWLPDAYSTVLRPMNWVLFRGQMNSINGIVDLLASIWIYAAYAYLSYPRRKRSAEGLAARVIALATWSFVLEWGQSQVPGRFADVTDVVVGLSTYILCYSYPWRHQDARRRSPEAPDQNRPWRKASLACVTGVVIMFVGGRLAPEVEEDKYALPALTDLPNAVLPDFRYQHPRFEAPASLEWSRLQIENPDYVKRVRRAAERGRLYNRILLARVSSELAIPVDLFEELIGLEFNWRGHQQTVPIALAYDWLYDRFDENQRSRMLAKVEAACDYQIEVITQRLKLSPYNVYLYNQPLQALMMAAIAQHGDSSSGRCMRFAYDYWNKRVLPVWEQVMGSNGGWHEGGEYLGIGVGSAVHRLPAMWRFATGEDAFANLPGLRGFVDFAVHRKQPDGSDIRVGDGAFHRNPIPDLAALAAELQHPAAYTLANPKAGPRPLGYPWGTWSDESLRDPQAAEKLPRARWFDGVGLLLARSGWSENATHVSFKAGNNYWSHMHLDQGAFTIFKEQPLAIDSGVYFNYGGEHHLNYMYQSIAHNVLTITDPEENSVLPGKRRKAKDGSTVIKPDRQIANDGGQRRVGSGWGLPAPLDLKDWKRQAETYQTVGERLTSVEADAPIVWVNADLTPAYTNEQSGSGDFWARSHRTEKYLRSFVYLSNLDVILVHDRVSLSASRLRTNWLLHSSDKPSVADDSFEVSTQKSKLRGKVLLPQAPRMNIVGGSGFEYYVGGKNYDEGGNVATALLRKGRSGIVPGAWRLELQDAAGGREQEFLVALQPESMTQPSKTLDLKVTDEVDHLVVEVNDMTIRLPKGMGQIEVL